MKKTNKPEIGKLTVIRPRRKAKREPQDARPDLGIIEEAIGAAQGLIEAGRRAHAVYQKIRGKK